MRSASLVLLLALSACRNNVTPESVPARPAATPDSTPAVHGHRGARGLRPENTLPAFEAALDLEVQVLELDVQLTRDGEVVVWHDPYVFAGNCRTSGGLEAPPISTANHRPSLTRDRPLDAPVVDPDSLPMLHPALAIANQRADQLRGLRCDRNPAAEKFPDQKPVGGALSGPDFGIVRLVELFEFVERYAASGDKTPAQRANAARVGFNIELKRSEQYPSFLADGFDGKAPGRFEHALYAALEEHRVSARTIVQSFDHRSLWAFRQLSASVRLSVLQLEGEPDFVDWSRRGAAVWSPDHRLVTGRNVAAAHAAGLLVVPWTVNDPRDARALIDSGIDGLITDRPDLVVWSPSSP